MKYNRPTGWSLALLLLAGCPNNPPAPATPVLTEVTVTCAPTTVNPGQTAQCSASATDQNGAPFAVSQYTWTSSNEAVARVDTAGKATSLAVGSVTVTASATADSVTKQGQATLSVTARPATLHTTNISKPETWHVADNPHEVKGQLSVDSSASLALEPGVEVRFDADAQLTVASGTLQASGTSAAPIVLGANGTGGPGSWRGLVLATAGSGSLLEHVRLSDCGASTGEGACLSVRGGAMPVLHDVGVSGSASVGVSVADDGSGFGATSDTLSVTQSAGVAVRLGANQGDSLPGHLSLSGNKSDSVELVGNVSRTQTWPNPGVPFVINGTLDVEGTDNSTPATLTVSAGSVFRFGAKGELLIAEVNPGALVVNGTAEAPVLFTADSSSPAPGSWLGVRLFPRMKPPVSRISHATFEYAGLVSPSASNSGTGNLTIYGDYISTCSTGACPVLTDVVLQKSSGTGLDMEDIMGLDASSARVTFKDNAGYAAIISANEAGTLPKDSTYSGNVPNAVKLLDGFVGETQTWANLGPGVAYVITEPVVEVGNNTPVTLTLAPGATVLFAKGSSLLFGWTGTSTGMLIAKGGPGADTIHFGPDDPTAVSGYWGGLHFWRAEGSQLDHVSISYGGSGGDQTKGILYNTGLNVYQELGPFITNSDISHNAGCAVYASDGRRAGTTKVTTALVGPASTLNNTVSDNGIDNQCASY